MARTVVTDKLLQDNLEFQGTESIRVPAGTTAQRGTPSGSGELRYNTELGTFEGYDGSNWGPIGAGVIDTDEDTYITAEATSDKDSLDFWTAGTERMNINSTGAVTISGDLIVNGTTTTLNSTNIEITESIIFEGSTADDFETTFNVVDPTADRTITLPDATGTIAVAAFVGANGSAGTIGLVPAPAAGDAAAGKFLKADGNWTIVDTSGGSIAIGTPTDTSWNDGALTGINETYDNHTPLTGFASTDTVPDAFDNVNELIHNVYQENYVRHAKFSASTLAGPATLTTTFTVDSDVYTGYDANSYEWDFGDGGTITTTNPSYQYAYTGTAGGLFDVTLTARNTNAIVGTTGSYATFKRTGYIIVYTPAPVALFKYSYNQATGSVSPTSHTTTPAYIDETSVGSGTTNNVTFDVTTSTNTTHWMIVFGDGSTYPANAVSSETDPDVITGVSGSTAWEVYSTTKTTTHPYAITTQDLEKNAVLHVFSLTAGATGAKDTSSALSIRIMKDYTGLISFTASPTSGNNDTASYNNSTNSINYEGIYTELTPALSSGAVTGSYNTQLSWDLSSALNSTGGQTHAYSAVLTQQDIVLKRTDNTTAPDSQTRTVTLTITSQHTSSPFAGGNTDITIKRDPRADFTGQFDTLSTGYSGSSNQKGYIFTDYNGAARNILTFADGSDVNGITGWSWDVDKNVSAGADYTIQNPQHTYGATGSHTVELTLTHPNTYGSGDIDYIKEITNYITISSNPTEPDTLQGKTLSLTSTHSNTPYLCSGFTDNSTSNPYAQDAQVTRSTSLVPETGSHDFANEFPSNTDNTGTVRAVINGTAETSNVKTFTIGDDSGTTGSLIITTDVDASDPSTSWNNTIPLLWYRVFKSKVKSQSNLSIGVNEYEVEQLFSSSNTSRKTAVLPFVIDTMTNTPSCSAFTVDMTGASSGTPRYMSSIVYFDAGSPTFKVSALTITDLSGHTYAKNVNPVQVVNNGGSLLSSSQDLSYANLSISTPVPINNSPTVGGLVSVPSGSSYGIGTVKVRARNVNGWGGYQTDSTNILYWFSTVNLDEQDMTNSITAGSQISGQTDLIRVSGFDNTSATPSYTAADFYANNAWVSQTTSLGTYEPPLLYTGGGRFEWDDTNWQTYLPGLTSNPNLSGRSAGTQYVTLAFCRTGLTSSGSFRIKYTGEISSLHLAIPGAGTDTSSGLNGWLDCNDAVSFGYPGSGSGGNGDDGVRHATVPGSGALGSFKTNGIFNISLNQANTGESGSITNNSVVLIRFGLSGTGKYVSAIAVEDYS